MSRENIEVTAAGAAPKLQAPEQLSPAAEADADLAWQELKDLLTTRIRNGLAGRVSGKSISEILQEETGA